MFQRLHNMHSGLADIQMYLCRVGLSRMLRSVYSRLTRFFHQIPTRDQKRSTERKTGNDLSNETQGKCLDKSKTSNDLSNETQSKSPDTIQGTKTKVKKEPVLPESIIEQPQ